MSDAAGGPEDEDYATKLLRISAAQISLDIGFRTATTSALDALVHIYREQVRDTAQSLRKYADHFGRTEPILDDLGLVLEARSASVSEIQDYMLQHKPSPFPFPVPEFPVKLKPKPLYGPKASEAELASRDPAIPAYFPSIHPPSRAGSLLQSAQSGGGAPGRLRTRRATSTLERHHSRVQDSSQPDLSALDAHSCGLVRLATPPPPIIKIRLPEPPTVPPPPPFYQLSPEPQPPVARIRINLDGAESGHSTSLATLAAVSVPLPTLSRSSDSSVPSASEGRLAGAAPATKRPTVAAKINKVGRPPGSKKRKPPVSLGRKKGATVGKGRGSLEFLFPGSGVPSTSRPASAASDRSEPPRTATPLKLTVPALKVKLSPKPDAPPPPVKRSPGRPPKSAKSALPGLFGGPSKAKAPVVAAAEHKKKTALKIKLKMPAASLSSSTSRDDASDRSSHKLKVKLMKSKKAKKRAREAEEALQLSSSTSQEVVVPTERPSEEEPAKLPTLKLKIKPLPPPKKSPERVPSPPPEEAKKTIPKLVLNLGGIVPRAASPAADSTASSPPRTPGGGASPIPKTPSPSSSPQSEAPKPKPRPTPSAILTQLVSTPAPKPPKSSSSGKKASSSKKTPKLKLTALAASPATSSTSFEVGIPSGGGGGDLWVCPVCGVAYSPDADMIACDGCVDERWFHWSCVGLISAPPENLKWFCQDCVLANVGNKAAVPSNRGRRKSTSSPPKKKKKNA